MCANTRFTFHVFEIMKNHQRIAPQAGCRAGFAQKTAYKGPRYKTFVNYGVNDREFNFRNNGKIHCGKSLIKGGACHLQKNSENFPQFHINELKLLIRDQRDTTSGVSIQLRGEFPS